MLSCVYRSGAPSPSSVAMSIHCFLAASVKTCFNLFVDSLLSPFRDQAYTSPEWLGTDTRPDCLQSYLATGKFIDAPNFLLLIMLSLEVFLSTHSALGLMLGAEETQ